MNRIRFMARAWAVPVLCAALALSALARTGPATVSPEYLRYFPSPEKVRADTVAGEGDARPEEIEGRVAGRLLMLAGALENTWETGYVNRETGEPIMGIEGAPPAAKRLREAYLQQYYAIRDGKREEYRKKDDCEGLFVRFLYFRTMPSERCDFRRYVSAEGDYKSGQEPAMEIAELYFPEQERARFVESTPSVVIGKWAAGNRAASEARKQDERAGSLRKNLSERIFAAAVLTCLLVALCFVWWSTRPAKAPDKNRVNRISDIQDLYLFDRRGRIVGTHERTSLHTTTTTSSSGGGGYVHPTYGGHVSAPTTNTSTTTTSTHHQTLFLREDDGDELEVKFTDLEFSVHEGSRVAIVYAGDRWSECGHPMGAVNLDTGKWAMAWNRIDWIATSKPAARIWFWAMLAPVAIVSLALAAGSWAMTWTGLGLAVVVVLGWLGGKSLSDLKAAITARLRAHVQEIAGKR